MLFIFQKKYLPDFMLCSATLIVLSMAACHGGDPAPISVATHFTADVPRDAVAPPSASPVEKSAPGPKLCEYQGNKALNKSNLPALETLKESVAASERKFTKLRTFRQAVLSYIETLSLNKEDARALAEGILEFSANTAEPLNTPESGTSPLVDRPLTSPAPLPTHFLHASIVAYTIYRYAFDFAQLSVYRGGMELNRDEAKALAGALYKVPLESFAAFGRAYEFARDAQTLDFKTTDAKSFADKVMRTPNPPQTILGFMEKFSSELELHSTPSQAAEAAEKLTCLPHG